MSYFSDALAFIDRIKFLKGLPKIAADVDDLKKRIASIEEKLGDQWPADVCKFCGAECAKTDHRVVKIK